MWSRTLGDTHVCALVELVHISDVKRDGTRLVNNAEHGNVLPGSGAVRVCAQLQIPSLRVYVKIHTLY